MARRRDQDRSWPPAPEALPHPVVDNHTHLESVEHVLPDGVVAPTVAEHLANASAVGVTRMVQVGCDLPSARWTDGIVREHAALLGAVAIHPNEAPLHAGVREVGPDALEPAPREHHTTGLDDAIAEIARIARSNDRVRAVGETGMDLFRTGPQGLVAQRESFRAHIALAKELGLALQIHDRDAHTEVLDILEADGAPERTVFHCFSGDAQMAEHCAARGWYLSFAGPVTFTTNDGLREALRRTPAGQVLVETDAPYLTPHPFRGRPNAPYLVPHTVRMVAAVQERSLEDVCADLWRTSHEVYGSW